MVFQYPRHPKSSGVSLEPLKTEPQEMLRDSRYLLKGVWMYRGYMFLLLLSLATMSITLEP